VYIGVVILHYESCRKTSRGISRWDVTRINANAGRSLVYVCKIHNFKDIHSRVTMCTHYGANLENSGTWGIVFFGLQSKRKYSTLF